MANIYRHAGPDADHRNPYRPLTTRRVPGNVPYIVDNLWEWRRPENMPSRRHCVCASPKPELAAKASGVKDGRLFLVEVEGAVMAQAPQWDVRDHPDVKTLPRLLLEKLGRSWVNGPAKEKTPEALLWSPCLTQEEVEEVFASESLTAIRETICDAIQFWNDTRSVTPNSEWPFPDGEIFFEAKSWTLLPVGSD